MKKILVFVSSFALLMNCLLLSLMLPRFTLVVEAHDNSDGYPYNVAPGVYRADRWGFFQCECTSFVAYCLNNCAGIWVKGGVAATVISAAVMLGCYRGDYETVSVGVIAVQLVCLCLSVIPVELELRKRF